MTDQLEVLAGIMEADPDVRTIVRGICAAHGGISPAELMDRHPDVFDELYEQIVTMTTELDVDNDPGFFRGPWKVDDA